MGLDEAEDGPGRLYGDDHGGTCAKEIPQRTPSMRAPITGVVETWGAGGRSRLAGEAIARPTVICMLVGSDEVMCW